MASTVYAMYLQSLIQQQAAARDAQAQQAQQDAAAFDQMSRAQEFAFKTQQADFERKFKIAELYGKTAAMTGEAPPKLQNEAFDEMAALGHGTETGELAKTERKYGVQREIAGAKTNAADARAKMAEAGRESRFNRKLASIENQYGVNADLARQRLALAAQRARDAKNLKTQLLNSKTLDDTLRVAQMVQGQIASATTNVNRGLEKIRTEKAGLARWNDPTGERRKQLEAEEAKLNKRATHLAKQQAGINMALSIPTVEGRSAYLGPIVESISAEAGGYEYAARKMLPQRVFTPEQLMQDGISPWVRTYIPGAAEEMEKDVYPPQENIWYDDDENVYSDE